jgi:hypothetical protein
MLICMVVLQNLVQIKLGMRKPGEESQAFYELLNDLESDYAMIEMLPLDEHSVIAARAA